MVDGTDDDPRISINNVGEKSLLELHPSSTIFTQHRPTTTANTAILTATNDILTNADPNNHSEQQRIVPRGGGLIPAGYNPFGYKITPIGERYLEFPGSLDSDIGRFIASIKDRKTLSNIKSQWLEIVRVSKNAQSMRIYRTLQDIIDFCLAAGFIN